MEENKLMQGLSVVETPIKITIADGKHVFNFGKCFLSIGEEFPNEVIEAIKISLENAYKLGYNDCSLELLNK